MAWFRTLFSRVRRANIPQNFREAFEQAGTGVIQTLLFLGSINPADLPEPLTRIGVQGSVERRSAIVWLNEKAHRAERKEIRMEAVEWAILLFVIFGVIVDALLFSQERRWLP